MKKFVILALFIVTGLVSCELYDDQSSYYEITDVTYSPQEVNSWTDVTVTLIADPYIGDIDMATLSYRVNENRASTIVIMSSETPHIYRGLIPPQASGSEVSFWVAATYTNGETYYSRDISYTVTP